MKMVAFTKSKIDDIDFISKVEVLTNEIVKDLNPSEIFLFKVDNWFDTKWLNFSGKKMGAIGIWNYKSNTRIPPFTPNRIIEQTYYKQNNFKIYKKQQLELSIHKKQSAEKNFDRKLIDLSESALFVWYSSNTIVNELGSLMIYSVNNDTCKSFYVGLKKTRYWGIVNSPGINKKTLEFYFTRNINESLT